MPPKTVHGAGRLRESVEREEHFETVKTFRKQEAARERRRLANAENEQQQDDESEDE